MHGVRDRDVQEPSTRSGRRFGRPSAGKSVVGVLKVHGSETILAVTERCRAIVCPAEEVNYLGGPGKGVRLIKVAQVFGQVVKPGFFFKSIFC